MNIIKFRGKCNNKWVYGYPYKEDELWMIQEYKENREFRYHIDNPDTIGQFSGLCDVNRREIYDGDIVKVTIIDGWGNDVELKGEVAFREGIFIIVFDPQCSPNVYSNITLYGAWGVYEDMEIVGNRYD